MSEREERASRVADLCLLDVGHMAVEWIVILQDDIAEMKALYGVEDEE